MRQLILLGRSSIAGSSPDRVHRRASGGLRGRSDLQGSADHPVDLSRARRAPTQSGDGARSRGARCGSARPDPARRAALPQPRSHDIRCGGLTTKTVALVDALGLARTVLAPGQRHDSVAVAPLVTGVDFDALFADKAFHNDAVPVAGNARPPRSSRRRPTAKRQFRTTPRCRPSESQPVKHCRAPSAVSPLWAETAISGKARLPADLRRSRSRSATVAFVDSSRCCSQIAAIP
jgi:hypothetical protein